jgi:hypothetical protein
LNGNLAVPFEARYGIDRDRLGHNFGSKELMLQNG